ncbi:MAG: phosphomannomutase [Porticoccaceae bacterium]|nr:MAG: phosphomannomutase [Porticoccaceae bacterium]
MKGPLTCFKAYDVRGRVPEELDEERCFRIGRAAVEVLGASRVVVGRDVRLSSPPLAEALAAGAAAAGCAVAELGLCGTEEVYFATFAGGFDAGFMVTASHNPADYNGIKLVGPGARPLGGEELAAIRRRAEGADFPAPARRGPRRPLRCADAYLDHLLGYVRADRLAPLTIVTNAGNGGAGRVVDLLEDALPFRFVKVHHEPDGRFPNGVPNPLLPDRRQDTAAAVQAAGADFGVAWDGDFDRCFFFDETGAFVEGYYLVGLLAAAFLEREPGGAVVHDPRLLWNTREVVARAGGRAVQSRTGHAFVKAAMRAADAVYGGEMSAHHYFRDFAYCDSGMIPWLMVAELLCRAERPLSALLAEAIAAFPCSGEINLSVADPRAALARVAAHYAAAGGEIESPDGISCTFPRWRFNLRASNTEPLLRLNVESRGDRALVERKVAEIVALASA